MHAAVHLHDESSSSSYMSSVAGGAQALGARAHRLALRHVVEALSGLRVRRAQMQWLLELIRRPAGEARAALAAVPESVVRDAAGWLTFIVRWGHADLLGGCDIAGLVQARRASSAGRLMRSKGREAHASRGSR